MRDIVFVWFVVAIVVAFFLCWAPFHTQRLMTASIPDGYWTKPLLEMQSVLFFISGRPIASSFSLGTLALSM